MRLVHYVCLLPLLLAVGLFAMEPRDGNPENDQFDELPDETEVVATFYRLLLQPQPPSFEQEKAIFSDSGLRTNLIEVQGGDADTPLILNLCRENRDLFIPRNVPEKHLAEAIIISSPFTWSRTVAARRAVHGTASRYVIVTFKNDAEKPGMRRIVFTVTGRRIEIDDILLDGFDSGDDMMLLTRFLKTPEGEWFVDVPGRK